MFANLMRNYLIDHRCSPSFLLWRVVQRCHGSMRRFFSGQSSRNWNSGERGWVNKSFADAGLGHIIAGMKVGTLRVDEDSEAEVTGSYTCGCHVR